LQLDDGRLVSEFDLVARVLAERLQRPGASEGLHAALVSGLSAGWEDVATRATNEFVVPAFAAAVRDLGLIGSLAPELRAFLAMAHAANVKRNGGLRSQLAAVVGAVNREGVEPVLLKGAIRLVDGLYPDPGWRMMRPRPAGPRRSPRRRRRRPARGRLRAPAADPGRSGFRPPPLPGADAPGPSRQRRGARGAVQDRAAAAPARGGGGVGRRAADGLRRRSSAYSVRRSRRWPSTCCSGPSRSSWRGAIREQSACRAASGHGRHLSLGALPGNCARRQTVHA
jgi:Uncharacterised nucleotidyltransferase